jgi:dihydrofolate synthase / folylpolyglutamate synthase
LATLAQEICPDLAHCQIYADEFAALEAACDRPGLKVLCGSLYLIGHFFATINAPSTHPPIHP